MHLSENFVEDFCFWMFEKCNYICDANNDNYNLMKCFTKVFIATCCMLLVCLPVAVAAQPNSDPEPDPLPIIVEELLPDPVNPNRAPALVPIECYYYSSLSSVVACFQYSLGTVNVEVKNLESGSVSSLNVNGTAGIHMIPVSSSPGSYSITFTLPDGIEYGGIYTIL